MILSYCADIDRTVTRFGDSFFIFQDDFDYINSISMSLIQIGEIVKNNLSEELKETYRDVDWGKIYKLRNIVVHAYSNISANALWKAIKNDVAIIEEYCRYVLSKI